MITLEELIAYRDVIDNLNSRSRVTHDEAEALKVANNMLHALVFQLDSQTVSFTP